MTAPTRPTAAPGRKPGLTGSIVLLVGASLSLGANFWVTRFRIVRVGEAPAVQTQTQTSREVPPAAAEAAPVTAADSSATRGSETVPAAAPSETPVTTTASASPASLADAVERRDAARVKALLDAGSDPNTRVAGGRNGARVPLIAVAVRNADLASVDLLLSRGADADATGVSGSPLLVEALMGGHKPIASRLTAAGAVLPRTAASLLAAAAAGNGQEVRRLVTSGIHVDAGAAEFGSATALLLATRNGNIDVIRWLLNAGANRERIDSETSLSPLGIAAAAGNVDAVRLLLDAGARLTSSASGEQFETPLHAASRTGRFEVVVLLLKAGAQPTEQFAGTTAIDAAANAGFRLIADTLNAVMRARGAQAAGQSAAPSASSGAVPVIRDIALPRASTTASRSAVQDAVASIAGAAARDQEVDAFPYDSAFFNAPPLVVLAAVEETLRKGGEDNIAVHLPSRSVVTSQTRHGLIGLPHFDRHLVVMASNDPAPATTTWMVFLLESYYLHVDDRARGTRLAERSVEFMNRRRRSFVDRVRETLVKKGALKASP